MPKSLLDKKFNLGAGDAVKVTTSDPTGKVTEHLDYPHTGPTTEVRIRVDLDEAEDLAKSDEHPMKAGIDQSDQPDLHRHPIHDAIETAPDGER